MWVAFLDLLCLLAGSTVGVMLRIGPEEMRTYVFNHLDGWLVFYGSIFIANYLAGTYRLQHTFSRFNLVVNWLFSLTFALLMLSLTSYAWFFTVLLGRGVLALSIAAYGALSLGVKLLVYKTLFRSNLFLCRAAVLGTGDTAKALRRVVEGELVIPAHRVVAFIRLPGEDATGEHGRAPVIDGVAALDAGGDSLEDVVRGLGVALLLVGLEDAKATRELYPQLRRLRFSGIEVLAPLTVAELYGGRTPMQLVDEESLMQASLESGFPLFRRVKRMMDVTVALSGGIVLAPLWLAVALAVKLSSPRDPVMYSQVRSGHFGKTFRIHKFRTMRHGVEQETGPVWSTLSDPRITRIGHVLRRFRLDEVPQIVNILRGEMSIVGPRPERPELIRELIGEIPYYEERQNVLPGLTGWAQIRYPYGSSVEDAARKLEYDLYYIKHLSFSLDLQIILSTLRIVLFGKERSV